MFVYLSKQKNEMKKLLLPFFLLFFTSTIIRAQISFQSTYGGSSLEAGSAITKTPTGYIIAGYTASAGSGSNDVWQINLNFNGDTLWTKTFGTSQDDYPSAIIKSSDGGYIIVGHSYSISDAYNIFLIKTDIE